MLKPKVKFCSRRAVLVALTLALLTIPTPAGRASTQNSQKIAGGAFTIGAGKLRYFQMNVGEGGAAVSGRFRASGGGGNDVEVLILDADGFENWLNGHSVRTYYNSGRVTVGRIKVFLEEGEYYLVYSNACSLMTPKAVETEVYLVRE